MGREDRPWTRWKPQRIADELRSLVVNGALAEGDPLGHEPDLIERFGVSGRCRGRRCASPRPRG